MKLGNIKFGISAVQSGQKVSTINAAPQLIVNSTTGKFTITSPVSKRLNIAVGETVMFLNNIASVESVIAERPEDLLTWAKENGVDIDTQEGQDAFIKEFSRWYIAKGEKLYDSKGNPIQASERYTKDDKLRFIQEHRMELVESNREALIERVGNPDATDEELLAAITVDDVESPKYHATSGSKTATTGSATGVGCQLSFTDTNIWNVLKEDLGDNKDKKNRVFDVKLDEVEKVPYSNGKETVEVSAYPIEFVEDTDPVKRETK